MLSGDAGRAELLMAELMVHAGDRTLKSLSSRPKNKNRKPW
jgi:hypothetical protein